MKVNLSNRIRNIELPKSAALLPLFEAVVNAFHGIEDADTSVGAITIRAIRESSLIDEQETSGKTPVTSFAITDNGVGFDDNNFNSFITSDSDYKTSRGGKGVGRLHYLKAFEHVEIESVFSEGESFLERNFRFDRNSDFSIDPKTKATSTARLTRVTLCNILPEYSANVPRSLDVLAQRIVEHSLSFFLQCSCPKVILHDELERIDLNDYFQNYCKHMADEREFTVKGSLFKLKGIRLYSPTDRDNSLILCAHGREVKCERLYRRIPILKAKLADESGEPFTYLGFITGASLDNAVNAERTGFNMDDRPELDGSLNIAVNLQDIFESAEPIVLEDLNILIEKVRKENESRITHYIEQVAPRYRILLSDSQRETTLNKLSPGADDRKLENELHQLLHEESQKAKEAMEQAIAIEPSSMSEADYLKAIQNAIGAYNEVGKATLADYVAHRKVIISFLEKAMNRDAETGKYSLEEVIHNLIFPMRKTSEEVDFNEHNLWLIDERLSFHAYLTSDISLQRSRRISSNSRLRADLLIFDRALAYSEGEKPVAALTVVEFKRPERKDYPEKPPIEQVTLLLDELRGEHYLDEVTGREIKLANEDVPAYVYIVCDLTKEVQQEARRSLQRTPDRLGYFGFIKEHNAYIEIISYEKLLNDARKRNRVLFEKLGIHGVDLA